MFAQFSLNLAKLDTKFIIWLFLSILAHIFILFSLPRVNNYEQNQDWLIGHGSRILEVKIIESKIDGLRNNPSFEANNEKPQHPEVKNAEKQTTRKNLEEVPEKARHPIDLAPTLKFYTLAELDKAPSILNKINLNSPELLQYSQTGNLKLRLRIDEKGNVLNAELVSTELPKQFAESALKEFQQAKFSPGLINTIPVLSEIKVTVHYGPTESQDIPKNLDPATP